MGWRKRTGAGPHDGGEYVGALDGGRAIFVDRLPGLQPIPIGVDTEVALEILLAGQDARFVPITIIGILASPDYG
ncbi:hypothetical protein ABZ553_13340 [Streptomyces sparsogenes]|uniref:hypothetical protein n=1 Tax=Streptomyces sparsogenes TaxID=67365 RepID=UPI0033CEEB34